MAATSTLRVILEALMRETGLGKVGTVTTGGTGSFIASGAEFLQPTTGSRWPTGSVIRFTSGTAVGSVANVTKYDPTTGTFTLTQSSLAVGNTDTFIISQEVDSTERFRDAINRAQTNHCSRWQKIPLTFVPDGDMMASGVTNWTATNGTATKVVLAYPEAFATQVVHLVTSAVNGQVQSDSIPVNLAGGDVWYFKTAMRATVASSTAQFVILDTTASATGTAITPSFTTGSATTTSFEFQSLAGTFTLPTTCKQIAFRLTGQENPSTVEMAPLIAGPQRATVYPFSNRVLIHRVGDFYPILSSTTPAGPPMDVIGNYIGRHGQTVRFLNVGNNLGVSFGQEGTFAQSFAQTNVTTIYSGNYATTSSLVYDEEIFGAELTNDTDTTTFPLDYVVKVAAYELFDRLESEEPRTTDNYGRPRATKWTDRLKRAGIKAGIAKRQYGAEKKVIHGRALSETR